MNAAISLKWFPTLILTMILTTLLGIKPASAERSDMYQAVTRVALAGKFSLSSGYQFLDIGTLFGTLLSDGEKVEETFALVKGKEYVFIAGGDDDARDIDLQIFSSSGRRAAYDTTRSSSAVVRFTPRSTGRYRVVLSMPASRTHESFCAMSVLTKDRSHGYEMRAESLLETLTRLETGFTVVENILEERGNDISLGFHSGTNSWMLMGAILKHKTGVASDPKRFGYGSYLGICVAEESCSDANLFVQNAGGRVLERGTDNGPYSFVTFDGASRNLISLAMDNAYSRRPSLVISAILRVRESAAATATRTPSSSHSNLVRL